MPDYRVRMMEFLIRTGRDHGWPDLPSTELARVLNPAGWDCSTIPGSGEHRLRCGDAEVSFTGEDVGWHLVIDGQMEQATAQAFVATVAAQIELEVAEPIKWLQIT